MTGKRSFFSTWATPIPTSANYSPLPPPSPHRTAIVPTQFNLGQSRNRRRSLMLSPLSQYLKSLSKHFRFASWQRGLVAARNQNVCILGASLYSSALGGPQITDIYRSVSPSSTTFDKRTLGLEFCFLSIRIIQKRFLDCSIFLFFN